MASAPMLFCTDQSKKRSKPRLASLLYISFLLFFFLKIAHIAQPIPQNAETTAVQMERKKNPKPSHPSRIKPNATNKTVNAKVMQTGIKRNAFFFSLKQRNA